MQQSLLCIPAESQQMNYEENSFSVGLICMFPRKVSITYLQTFSHSLMSTKLLNIWQYMNTFINIKFITTEQAGDALNLFPDSKVVICIKTASTLTHCSGK